MTKGLLGRNIHLAGLRYFFEVARVGSFRGAAEQLHVAASAINRQVQILEEELGCALFDRGRGRAGLRLTAAGQILLDDVRAAMDSIEHACSEITALHGLRRGNVEVGINEGFASAFFPKFLTHFSGMHPAIVFDVRVDSSPALIDMLMDNELELVLAYNPPPRFGVQMLARYVVDTMVMMHKSHPLATKKTLTSFDLGGQSLLLPSSDLGSRRYLDELLVPRNILPKSILTTNSYSLRRQAVMEKLGIMVMCFHPIHRIECGPDVVFRVIKDRSIAQQELVCCKKAGRELTAATTLFAAQLKAALDQGGTPEVKPDSSTRP
jgi:DNA-binding transcriptional LysR family regulator